MTFEFPSEADHPSDITFRGFYLVLVYPGWYR